ncbi:lysine exporter LysO family protein [Caldivirga sp. UBA161]|uniref:lysine exporter LysO family protein n=1 Tax=Caldivirga sp. UBA161 TaxID=1915569 RepID=UPI0025C18C35|nr:lysine exporter LysO family protein [Caldivirga sp. UBA161]
MDIAGFIFIAVFAASIVIGKLTPASISEASDKAVMPIVIILIFTISLWGGGQLTSISKAGSLIAYSLIYSLLTVALSYTVGIMIGERRRNGSLRLMSKTPLIFIVTLAIGWLTGVLLHVVDVGNIIEVELIALAGVIGLSSSRVMNVKSLIAGGRIGIQAGVSALLGGLLSGLILSYAFSIRLNVSLAIALGMGWYTFTGPVVALYAGPYYGLLAFLSNFLREQLTFILVPFIPGTPQALISIGGATSMDDTLPVYVSALGKDYSVASISNGLLLTILVPIVVPLVLAI